MNEIEVVAARLGWADEFSNLADQIRNAVGAEASRVDHVGSTSVSGLSAKDVIDIQVSVSDLANKTVTTRLVGMGYRQLKDAVDNLVGIPEGSPELQKSFFLEPEGQRRTHVHVRELGRLNQEYPLLFRDFLRGDAFILNAYQTIKVELAKRFPNDMESYYAIKDPYMDTVYRAAQAWAKLTDWKQDNDFR